MNRRRFLIAVFAAPLIPIMPQAMAIESDPRTFAITGVITGVCPPGFFGPPGAAIGFSYGSAVGQYKILKGGLG